MGGVPPLCAFFRCRKRWLCVEPTHHSCFSYNPYNSPTHPGAEREASLHGDPVFVICKKQANMTQSGGGAKTKIISLSLSPPPPPHDRREPILIHGSRRPRHRRQGWRLPLTHVVAVRRRRRAAARRRHAAAVAVDCLPQRPGQRGRGRRQQCIQRGGDAGPQFGVQGDEGAGDLWGRRENGFARFGRCLSPPSLSPFLTSRGESSCRSQLKSLCMISSSSSSRSSA